MKPIQITLHAQEQALERGASEFEIRLAILKGEGETVKLGRKMFRYNFPYGKTWQGKYYDIKQVAPVIIEEPNRIVIITVYTFYF